MARKQAEDHTYVLIHLVLMRKFRMYMRSQMLMITSM